MAGTPSGWRAARPSQVSARTSALPPGRANAARRTHASSAATALAPLSATRGTAQRTQTRDGALSTRAARHTNKMRPDVHARTAARDRIVRTPYAHTLEKGAEEASRGPGMLRPRTHGRCSRPRR
eukprot:350044-Chlamydomonas_euryale.AAC.2